MNAPRSRPCADQRRGAEAENLRNDAGTGDRFSTESTASTTVDIFLPFGTWRPRTTGHGDSRVPGSSSRPRRIASRRKRSALRKIELDPLFVPEQGDRRAPEDAVPEEPETAKQVMGIACTRILEPAPPDRFLHGGADFVRIEIIDRPSVRWLVLPALFAVHALEQHSLILVGAHLHRGVAHPPIRDAPVQIRVHGQAHRRVRIPAPANQRAEPTPRSMRKPAIREEDPPWPDTST